MDRFLASGFVDSFRVRHKEENGHFTWWDPKTNKRKSNYGWRLDYVLVSKEFHEEHVTGAGIDKDQMGSDHCPVWITLHAPPPLSPHPAPLLSSVNMKKKAVRRKCFNLEKQPKLSSFFGKKSESQIVSNGKKETQKELKVTVETKSKEIISLSDSNDQIQKKPSTTNSTTNSTAKPPTSLKPSTSSSLVSKPPKRKGDITSYFSVKKSKQ